MTLLRECWTSTGFGELRVDSERFKEDKIRVIVRGTTHYRFVLSAKDVQNF